MRWIGTLARELTGLFVDDGHFALAILLCLVTIAALLRLAPVLAGWAGPLLFAGLVALLLWSCRSAIARHAGRRKG